MSVNLNRHVSAVKSTTSQPSDSTPHSPDKSKIDLSPYTPGKPDDHRFVYWLVHHHKLQGIPPSSFYSDEHKKLAEHYIRFCFIKVGSA